MYLLCSLCPVSIYLINVGLSLLSALAGVTKIEINIWFFRNYVFVWETELLEKKKEKNAELKESNNKKIA